LSVRMLVVFSKFRLFETPRSIVTDSVYGRLGRRIRPYFAVLHDPVLRRISPWPYREKYGDRIRSVYARKRVSLENYGTLTMALFRFMPLSPEMESTYRPVDIFHLWSPLRSDWSLKINWSERKKTESNKLRKILTFRWIVQSKRSKIEKINKIN
jgi:hypothetical protein